ncbi:MAG TPA: heme exporter protein CcmB [Candidatus Limnocylindria bacterium]|jgi:heme exporter protein B|nr:heme exporter protein CcmB [Candidatus Limnocylindria bacterium]
MNVERALLVAARELAAERRHPDGLVSALTFTGLLVLLESLAFGPGRAREPATASAIFWIAILFAATLVATRSFDRELEDDAIDAILVLDGGREALYAGKLIAIAVVLAIVAFAGAALSLVLLDLDVMLAGHLALVGVLGVLALPPVIVLATLLALRVRARVALVPILSFPILVPQLVACTQGAAAALAGDGAAALGWSGILAAFALVYGVLGLTIVPAAIE